jgi:hypothetical protein
MYPLLTSCTEYLIMYLMYVRSIGTFYRYVLYDTPNKSKYTYLRYLPRYSPSQILYFMT